MVDRPILFSGPMVRALLASRKTMTRRLATSPLAKCEPGDRLWVRETWMPHSIYADMKPRKIPRSKVFYQADEEYAPSNTPWVPSIHMPRWASRLTLIVTAKKVERLQEISEADAAAEGVEPPSDARDEHDWRICPKCGGTGLHGALSESFGYSEVDCVECNTCAKRFRNLWESLHGRGSWDANPEIVALTFRVERQNIDKLEPTHG